MVHWYVYTPVAFGITATWVPVVWRGLLAIPLEAANVTVCPMAPVHVHVTDAPAVTLPMRSSYG